MLKTTIRPTVLLLLVTLLIAPAVVSGQEAAMPVKLTAFAGNPVLTADPALAYEEGGIGFPNVFYEDGQYHMLYMGYSKNLQAGSVNYATSTDGLEWTRYADNPVFVPEETLAENGVMQFAALQDGDHWLMYFVPWPGSRSWDDLYGFTYLATAPKLTGPWTTAPEPVLDQGDPPDWDYNGRGITSVLKVNDTYEMYYTAKGTFRIGRATSPDGILWTRYNDLNTHDNSYKNADPVFSYMTAATGAWDKDYTGFPVVRWRGDGYEMFYSGAVHAAYIGYATSPDGIAWTRAGDQPLLKGDWVRKREDLFASAAVEANGREYLYYTIARLGTPKEIAVATIERQ